MGESLLNWLLLKLSSLYEGKFFGSIELQFENGKIVHMKTISSEKPPVDTPKVKT